MKPGDPYIRALFATSRGHASLNRMRLRRIIAHSTKAPAEPVAAVAKPIGKGRPSTHPKTFAHLNTEQGRAGIKAFQRRQVGGGRNTRSVADFTRAGRLAAEKAGIFDAPAAER